MYCPGNKGGKNEDRPAGLGVCSAGSTARPSTKSSFCGAVSLQRPLVKTQLVRVRAVSMAVQRRSCPQEEQLESVKLQEVQTQTRIDRGALLTLTGFPGKQSRSAALLSPETFIRLVSAESIALRGQTLRWYMGRSDVPFSPAAPSFSS